MSEIRNLTRNGETFYPLTHIEAVLDESGTPLGVDDVPTEDSDKLVRSGSVYEELTGKVNLGDIIGDPTGTWNPGTAEEYIDQKIAEQNNKINLNKNLISQESATRRNRDSELESLINAGIRTGEGVVFDTTPTSGSVNAVTSNGIHEALYDDSGVYNVSYHHPTSGVSGGATYTLALAYAAVPSTVQRGGLTLKFIGSTSSKYEYYRLTTASWPVSFSESDWESLNIDDVPTAGSDNLVTSGGAFSKIEKVIAQSPMTKITNLNLFEVDIKKGDVFKIRINAKNGYSRIICCYNGLNNNRIFDTDNDNSFVNKSITVVNRYGNITSLGLYIVGDVECSISLIDTSTDYLENIFFSKNLLFGKSVKIARGYYYNGSAANADQDYSYFIVPVENGKTYLFSPRVRFLAKNGTLISNTNVDSYTADFTGELYVTFYNEDYGLIMTEEASLSNIIGYNIFDVFKVDNEPIAGSNNLVTSNGVFSMINNVIAQSDITQTNNSELLSVNISSGDTFKVMVNVEGTFSRLILNYNENANKRLIDSDDAGDFSNQPLTFVAKENITKLGLYITGTCKASISLLKPYNIDDKVNDIDVRLDNLLYGDNILLKKNTLCFHNKYYNAAAVNSNNYTYFAFPVESGKTYHIYPKVRFISKDGLNIQGESTKDVSYTADFTGNLYVTFFNDSPNWIVTEKESFTGIAGYDTIAKVIFENKRGISDLYSVSQLGLRDVVAEYVYGSKNLVSTALCKDGYYYNSGPSANNSYLYFKVALEANVDYYVSPGIRYISKEGQNIAAYPDLTNSFIVFTPDTSTDYYFTYNKGEDITGYFVGKKQGFIHPNTLFAKKWVSCGDSFTKGDFNGATGSTTFADMPYVGQKMTYPFFIGRRCGMNVVNEAISGSTMAYVDGNRNEFSTANGRYTQLPADADYITLWFGINDSHQSVPIGNIDDNVNTTFYGAWNIVMDYLISNHPNAKIGIIISNGCDTTAYPAATRSIAKKWGVSYLDLNGDYKVPLMLRTNEKTEVAATVLQSVLEKQSVNYPSNQHPNVAAHEYESYFIESWLKSL